MLHPFPHRSYPWLGGHTPYRAIRGVSSPPPSSIHQPPHDLIRSTAPHHRHQPRIPSRCLPSRHPTSADNSYSHSLPTPIAHPPIYPSIAPTSNPHLPSSVHHHRRCQAPAAREVAVHRTTCSSSPFPANRVSRLGQGSPPHHTSKWHDR